MGPHRDSTFSGEGGEGVREGSLWRGGEGSMMRDRNVCRLSSRNAERVWSLRRLMMIKGADTLSDLYREETVSLDRTV